MTGSKVRENPMQVVLAGVGEVGQTASLPSLRAWADHKGISWDSLYIALKLLQEGGHIEVAHTAPSVIYRRVR